MLMPMGSVTSPRVIGELLGTALLVCFSVSALFATRDTLATAIAVLCTTVLLSWIFAGSHFNPWVTIATAIRGTTGWASAGIIVAAQLAGGILGGLLVLGVFSNGAMRGLGTTRLAAEASTGTGLIAALLAETLVIFVLACVVFAQEKSNLLGVGMGLAYAAGTLAISDVTGASMNFARTLGPEVALTFADGFTEWPQIWVYAVAGVLGAALAGLLYPLWNASKAQEE